MKNRVPRTRKKTNGARQVDELYWAGLGANNMSDATVMLSAVKAGDADAAKDLPVFIYDEFRRLAASKLAYESLGQTLQPTALVPEVWLRLVSDETRSFKDRDWQAHGLHCTGAQY
jgi:hypothetical protein